MYLVHEGVNSSGTCRYREWNGTAHSNVWTEQQIQFKFLVHQHVLCIGGNRFPEEVMERLTWRVHVAVLIPLVPSWPGMVRRQSSLGISDRVSMGVCNLLVGSHTRGISLD